MNLQIPVSIGELIDKISILEIKLLNITDPNKLKNIKYELECLTQVLNDTGIKDKVTQLHLQLFDVNKTLWDLEETIRQCDENQIVDNHFINTARQIYKKNDERSHLKKKINLKFNSNIIEEKSYKK